MSATPSPPPTSRWRRNAVALFVTFHITCVFLYALPRPPSVRDAILEHPEVKAELEASVGKLHELLPWRDTADEQLRDLLRIVRAYQSATDRARRLVSPYLNLVASTQSWHMFGGTPPRFPLVFAVEVRPRYESEYVLFQDLNWGTLDSAAMNFRHRKVHENLAAWEPDASWDQYARYWGRRWDERHPDRPARVVRLSVTRLTTPAPEAVRAGVADRHPEPGLQVHEWTMP
jgi:hypothetical protein